MSARNHSSVRNLQAAGRTTKRRIEPSVRVVPGVHDADHLGPRLRGGRAAHQSIARGVHRWPEANADAGEERPAVRGAFIGDGGIDGTPEHVRLNLMPEARPRAAATEPNAADGNAELGQDG